MFVWIVNVIGLTCLGIAISPLIEPLHWLNLSVNPQAFTISRNFLLCFLTLITTLSTVRWNDKCFAYQSRMARQQRLQPYIISTIQANQEWQDLSRWGIDSLVPAPVSQTFSPAALRRTFTIHSTWLRNGKCPASHLSTISNEVGSICLAPCRNISPTAFVNAWSSLHKTYVDGI